MGVRGIASRVIVALCVALTGFVAYADSAVASGPPTVEEEWATAVVLSTARLNARVNPGGLEATYRFEYGTSSTYGSSTPASGGAIAPGEEGVEIDQQVVDLQPGTTYHYRVVVTNAAGTTDGEDQTFSTFATPPPTPLDTCPNAAYRVRFSAALPDCRAFEMVSPVAKNGADVSSDAPRQSLASESGDRILYMTRTGFGEDHGSGRVGYSQHVAERVSDGWKTTSVTPTPNPNNAAQIFFGWTELIEFSSDLGTAALIGDDLPEAPPGSRPKTENLYLENTTTAKLFATITDDRNEGENLELPFFYLTPQLGGASASLDVVTFSSTLNLVPQAQGEQFKAYVYEHGEVKLLGVLPGGGIPPEGSNLVFGSECCFEAWDERALIEKDTVSTDGSRILFEVREHPHQLYMRKDGTTSVLVTESETSTPVTAEQVELMGASPDLKHIVFYSSSQLLDNAPEGGGMYLYTDGPDPENESNLTYIGGGNRLLGISEDGTHIYYVNTNASTVSLWDSGQTRQIAPEAGVPFDRYYFGMHWGEASVTPDGREIAFMASKQLTVNGQVATSLPYPRNRQNTEVYVYKEDSNSLKCVSCPSTGALATLGVETAVQGTETVPYIELDVKTRFLSTDGRYVFFNTEEALVPQDTNGVTDAYEYDTVTGRLSLVSTGAGEDPAWFVDTSASGHDVFLVTRQQISGWDPDKLVDVYDARVEGGLPEPPPPAPECIGDACQGTPSAAPTFNTASGFVGLGNPSFQAIKKRKPKGARNQGLKHALKMCRKKPKRRRARCERAARRHYGAHRSAAVTRRTGR